MKTYYKPCYYTGRDIKAGFFTNLFLNFTRLFR